MRDEITVKYEDLPCTIGAFTVERDGHYTVVVNAKMSSDRQQESIAHELLHIECGDFDARENADMIEAERHKR